MGYYLGESYDIWKTSEPDLSDDYDLIEASEQLLEEASDDEWLFCEVENEVIDRYPEKLTNIHMDAINGKDTRNALNQLFLDVIKECLSENRDYFKVKD